LGGFLSNRLSFQNDTSKHRKASRIESGQQQEKAMGEEQR
jgi:hypothetical protein